MSIRPFTIAVPHFKRAMEAGAESLTEVMDSFFGERGGRVKDPFGNLWLMITQSEELRPRLFL